MAFVRTYTRETSPSHSEIDAYSDESDEEEIRQPQRSTQLNGPREFTANISHPLRQLFYDLSQSLQPDRCDDIMAYFDSKLTGKAAITAPMMEEFLHSMGGDNRFV
jgi:hypothetical protein